MRKLLCLLCLLVMLCSTALAEPLPIYDYTFSGNPKAEHLSDSLWWRIEGFYEGKVICYLVKIWMQNPGQQIGKATADWEKNTMSAANLAKRAPEASLLINASGYVTKTYKWVPENYPGEGSDYYFTPLGSVTVTNGEVFRCLEGVPYYGLTLNTDGLRLHVGDDPQAVLAQNPTQTWSFYDECPLIVNHQPILDVEAINAQYQKPHQVWSCVNNRAMRNVVMKMDANNYAIFLVTSKGGGMTLADTTAWIKEHLDPEWAYNLDGGPSAVLMYRNEKNKLQTKWASTQRNVDLMTFSELTAE